MRSANRILQDEPSQAEARDARFNVRRQSLKVNSPWMTQAEAAVHAKRKSVKAFYEWRKKHGIVVQDNLVARADVDRAIRESQRKSATDGRGKHPNSLRNLRRQVI